jgi:hypothetical protein
MRERADSKAAVQRVRSDDTYTPPQSKGLVRFVAEVGATVDEKPITTYMFTLGTRPHFVLVLGKSKDIAQQALDIALSVSFWDAAGRLLKAGFLWAHWHLLRVHCAERAASIRQGLPALGAGDGFFHEERTTLYANAGLSVDAFGPWVDVEAMESYDYDWASLFSWFETKPTDVLTHYFAKAWQSRELVEAPDEHLSATDLESMAAHGLATRLPPLTVPELLEETRIADLRRLVAEAGSKFKAQRGHELRQHLLQLAPPFLEARLRASERGPRYKLLAPPEMSWRQFQNFRQSYCSMVSTMQEWLNYGHIASEADKFYRPSAGAV